MLEITYITAVVNKCYLSGWSLGGRKRRVGSEMQWKREVERVMKQNNVTPVIAVNRQIWRKANENRQPK